MVLREASLTVLVNLLLFRGFLPERGIGLLIPQDATLLHSTCHHGHGNYYLPGFWQKLKVVYYE